VKCFFIQLKEWLFWIQAKTRRLDIGELQRGDQFWMVGPHKISGFNDMVQRLIDGCRAQERTHPGADRLRVRVVYNYIRAGNTGSNTQYMTLTKKDLEDLLATQMK
jgi:hypothetical protein